MFEHQLRLPVVYDGVQVDAGYESISLSHMRHRRFSSDEPLCAGSMRSLSSASFHLNAPWWRFSLPLRPLRNPALFASSRTSSAYSGRNHLLDQLVKPPVYSILIVAAVSCRASSASRRQRHLRAAELAQSILRRRLALPEHAVGRDRHVDEHVAHAALRVAVLVEREQRAVAVGVLVDLDRRRVRRRLALRDPLDEVVEAERGECAGRKIGDRQRARIVQESGLSRELLCGMPATSYSRNRLPGSSLSGRR